MVAPRRRPTGSRRASRRRTRARPSSGLADALRVFEIHPGQCGVLLYVADALAAAFVVPHPADYRALHPTLLHDLYGELIHHYATVRHGRCPTSAPASDDTAVPVARRPAGRGAPAAAEWADFHDRLMAGGLLGDEYTFQHVYAMGRYRLSRFLPPFERRRENHIGEIDHRRGRARSRT